MVKFISWKGYEINRSDAISAILSEYIDKMETTAHIESVKTSAYDLKLLIDYYYDDYNLVRRRSNGSWINIQRHWKQ